MIGGLGVADENYIPSSASVTSSLAVLARKLAMAACILASPFLESFLGLGFGWWRSSWKGFFSGLHLAEITGPPGNSEEVCYWSSRSEKTVRGFFCFISQASTPYSPYYSSICLGKSGGSVYITGRDKLGCFKLYRTIIMGYC